MFSIEVIDQDSTVEKWDKKPWDKGQWRLRLYVIPPILFVYDFTVIKFIWSQIVSLPKLKLGWIFCNMSFKRARYLCCYFASVVGHFVSQFSILSQLEIFLLLHRSPPLRHLFLCVQLLPFSSLRFFFDEQPPGLLLGDLVDYCHQVLKPEKGKGIVTKCLSILPIRNWSTYSV